MEKADGKMRARVLRFLSQGEARPAEAMKADKMLLDGGDRGAISVRKDLLAGMLTDGTLRLKNGVLALAGGEGTKSRQDDIGPMTVDTGQGPEIVMVNRAESPLAQLVRRKDRDGKAFLSEAEFRAGERLRMDYTRGQIMPRLGANWEASVSSGRRDGGIADLSDAALAARLRVEKAIRAVGPELSGVLIDVCCFLKGMETVEMERGWPVRSAKIMLKTALGALSRHYNPEKPVRQRQVFHWGAADYRPSIT